MDEMKEFYKTNPDFKLYVDRYCNHYRYILEEALSHALIREVYKYYKDIQERKVVV